MYLFKCFKNIYHFSSTMKTLSICLFLCLNGFIGENTSKVFHTFQRILVEATFLALLTMSRRARGCVREQGRSSSPLQGQGQVAHCSTYRRQMVEPRNNALYCTTATTSSLTAAAHCCSTTLCVRYHEQKCE